MANVADIANIDEKNAVFNALGMEVGSYTSDCISDRMMIPDVAKADSQSPESKIANGWKRQITNTDTQSDVKESRVLESKNKSEDMISIIPARITVIGKPVRIMYAKVKIIVNIFPSFFPAILVINEDKPMTNIARCIPLSASICDIPILEKSSLICGSR